MTKKLLTLLLVITSMMTSMAVLPLKTLADSPVQTFTSSYKGYNTSTSWLSKMDPAARCTDTQKIYGARPTTPGNYPVLLYIHGTYSDLSGNKEGQLFVKQAAAQGFVAMALTYNSSTSLNENGIARHAFCMFDQDHPSNGVSTACAVVGADCSNGVLLSGFSQGAAISAIAKNYNPQVKAVWAIGLSAYIYPFYKVPTNTFAAPYGTRALSNDKLVINVGQSSSLYRKTLISQDMPSLEKLTGLSCNAAFNCLQADGSGYYVVQNSEVQDKVADHCYWMNVNKSGAGLSCTLSPTQFDPGFTANGDTLWSMTRNLNWLRTQLTN